MGVSIFKVSKFLSPQRSVTFVIRQGSGGRVKKKLKERRTNTLLWTSQKRRSHDIHPRTPHHGPADGLGNYMWLQTAHPIQPSTGLGLPYCLHSLPFHWSPFKNVCVGDQAVLYPPRASVEFSASHVLVEVLISRKTWNNT